MSHRLSKALLQDRRRFVAAVAFTLSVTLATLWWASPLVPRNLTILSGPEGSSKHADALLYAEFLARHGVRAAVVETDGSVDNVERIATSALTTTVALAEAGIEDLAGLELGAVESLGAVRIVPLWLFVRRDVELGDERDLKGRLFVPGEAGSAARAIVTLLLEENDMSAEVLSGPLAEIPAERTLEVLEAGQADAAFIIGAPGAPAIDALLESDLVKPVSQERAAAYDRRNGRLTEVALPRGAFDLGRDIPSKDLQLLATSIQMLASDQLSPALVDLMLDAATAVHREATLFTPAGHFPRPDGISQPLAHAAERFYAQGPSPLRRWLPYWLATLADRFALVAAAILGAVFAVLSVLPTIFAVPFNLALGRIYRRIEAVEKGVGIREPEELLAELDELVEVARALEVPRGQLPPYFEMRQNIFDTRDRVLSAQGTESD